MQLSTIQVLAVEQELQTAALSYAPLQEELLDHICCCIETKMANGMPFEDAKDVVFQAFSAKNIQTIEQKTIYLLDQKSRIMKRLAFGVLGILLLSVTTLWAVAQDPPNRSPLGEGFKVTSNFGFRFHPIHKVKKMHKGMDFRAPIGTPVYATADGEVTKTKQQKRLHGNYIILKHDAQFETFYAHLSEIKVKEGQFVKKGDLIGLVGTSGRSTSPHLHYEVRKEGEAVDPLDYLKP